MGPAAGQFLGMLLIPAGLHLEGLFAIGNAAFHPEVLPEKPMNAEVGILADMGKFMADDFRFYIRQRMPEENMPAQNPGLNPPRKEDEGPPRRVMKPDGDGSDCGSGRLCPRRSFSPIHPQTITEALWLSKDNQ
jgi:hypothetical protein